MELRLLGPIEVFTGERAVRLGKRQHRLILGILGLEAGRLVPAQRLIHLLWGDNPPSRPRAVLHSRISELRAALTEANAGGRQGWLVTDGDGYVLRIEPAMVDAYRFRDLLAAARRHERDGQLCDALRRALALWRGPALGGWLPGASHDLLCRALESSRLSAAEDLYEVELRLGHHRSVVDELIELSAANPARDRLTSALMLALHRCGRSAEAVEVFHQRRTWLSNELGLDPGRELQQLHVAVLRDDPALLHSPAPEASEASEVSAVTVVPHQLPPPVMHFAGRRTELQELTVAIGQTGTRDRMAIVAIDGPAGVGKTALAVSWAHAAAQRFDGGQLYVNLRGFDPIGAPASPAEAIRGLLEMLAVAPQRIPPGLDAQVGLYRSLLAGRRMLVVLDNARDAEQVRPLLPGSPGCAALVTSRNRLSSLVAVEAAHPLTLGLLSTSDARLLLARRLGAGRVDGEPEAVAEIITRCAGLPLALAIVAARAATNPGVRLSALAGQLGHTGDRLDALSAGDAASDMRAVYSWSYRALSDSAARMVRLIGIHPGPDLSAAAAASLAGVPPRLARPTLAELTGANLLVEDGAGRFSQHDLVRVYAAELAASIDPAPDRASAMRRLLDHYLHTAHTAIQRLNRYLEPISIAQAAPGTYPEQPSDHGEGLAWFRREHATLIAAAEHALAEGWDTFVWQLAWAMSIYLERNGYWHDQETMQRWALSAGERLGDPMAQAQAHYGLARPVMRLGRFDECRAHLLQALQLQRQRADKRGQALTHDTLAEVWGRMDNNAQALHHATQSLELSRETGHRLGQARSLNTIGWLQSHLGQHDQALEACGQALSLFQEFGDITGEAAALDSLGHAYHNRGDHATAIDCYTRAAGLYRDLGDRHGLFGTLTDLGDTQQSAGDIESARAAWREAAEILDDIQHPFASEVHARLAATVR